MQKGDPLTGARIFTGCLALSCLVACIQVPELDDQIGSDLARSPYPALVPLPPILDGWSDPVAAGQNVEDDLTQRAAALDARAERLRRPVLGADDRRRLGAGSGS